jgi:hypothetical protein
MHRRVGVLNSSPLLGHVGIDTVAIMSVVVMVAEFGNA